MNLQTFKSYLIEQVGGSKIPLDQLAETLNKLCSDSISAHDNHPLYRGNTHMFETVTDIGAGLFNSDQGIDRKSHDTNNFYTTVFDHLFKTEFPQFPLRSRSFICTGNISDAKAYGEHVVIIPTNDAKIGNIGSRDIWNTRLTIFGANWPINEINKRMVGLLGVDNPTYDLFMKADFPMTNDAVQEMIKTYPQSYSLTIEKFKEEIINAYRKVIINNFRAITPREATTTNGEMWVGGECVVILPEVWKSLQIADNKWIVK